jgi:hypothetical protein
MKRQGKGPKETSMYVALTDTDEQIKFIVSYDYKLVSRAEFDAATDLPAGLRERASQYEGSWVVYDPLNDDEGFLLVGNDREALAKEAYEHVETLL